MFCLTSFFKFVFLQADPSLWRSCTGRQASYYHLHCHLHHFCIIIHHINVSYIICLMVLSRDVLIFQPGFRADSHEVFLFFFAMSILHMIWTTVINPTIHLERQVHFGLSADQMNQLAILKGESNMVSNVSLSVQVYHGRFIHSNNFIWGVPFHATQENSPLWTRVVKTNIFQVSLPTLQPMTTYFWRVETHSGI